MLLNPGNTVFMRSGGGNNVGLNHSSFLNLRSLFLFLTSSPGYGKAHQETVGIWGKRTTNLRAWNWGYRLMGGWEGENDVSTF